MYSAEEKMISGIRRCWSMRSRPIGLFSASLIAGRTPQFTERKWCRYSKCCPAVYPPLEQPKGLSSSDGTTKRR